MPTPVRWRIIFEATTSFQESIEVGSIIGELSAPVNLRRAKIAQTQVGFDERRGSLLYLSGVLHQAEELGGGFAIARASPNRLLISRVIICSTKAFRKPITFSKAPT